MVGEGSWTKQRVYTYIHMLRTHLASLLIMIIMKHHAGCGLRLVLWGDMS